MKKFFLTLAVGLCCAATAWTQTIEVFYIDVDGTEQSVEATRIDRSQTEYGTEGATNWYFVEDNVSLDALGFQDIEANLILADGAKLTVNGSEGFAVTAYGLTIYGQHDGTGQLAASAEYNGELQSAAIDIGSLTVNGGHVTATGVGKCAGITSSYFGVNGGSVTATGGANDYGVNIGFFIELNGGTLTANSYSTFDGSVAIANGLGYTDGAGNIYSGSIDDLDAIAGKKLQRVYYYIDANGTERACTDYTILTRTTNNYGAEGETNWYVMDRNVGFYRLTFDDEETHLILTDGMSVTIHGGYENDAAVKANQITIYGQSEGTGQFLANNADGNVIVADGDITVNGGHVTVNGGGTGIVSYDVTVNGGNVRATDGENGYGIFGLSSVTLGGGTVTANSYSISDGSVGIANGLTYTDGAGNIYSGSIDDLDAIKNKTMQPAYSITLPEHVNASGAAAQLDDAIFALAGVDIALSYTGHVPTGNKVTYSVNGSPIEGNNFEMPAANVNVTAALADVWGIGNDADGSEEHPYIITTPAGLDLLAATVNSGTDFSDTYFKLGADITYNHNTEWNDADCEQENNYEAIGYYDGTNDRYFCGHFDGAGHTISGIRIYKGGYGNVDKYQGIFGRTNESATIRNLRLADTRITGYSYTGGIVGENFLGTVTDCHVASNVCIHAVQTALYHGGIVGSNNSGTVANSTCAATLIIAPGVNSCRYYGAIAGSNDDGTLRDNFAIGATVPAAGPNRYGAIVGSIGGTLQRNYYTACTVAGVANATGVGRWNADVTTNDGAVPALRDNADNSTALALLAALDIDLGWGAGKFPLQLTGRTLYADGDWNTLTLPFSLDDFAGSPLEGATVMELDTEGNYEGHQTGYTPSTGTLSLYFKDATSIEAGKPYLVKWETTGEDIENPVFEGVTVSNEDPEECKVTSADGNVEFIGNYGPEVLDANDKSNLYLGAENKLYWPSADRTVNACRAYFHVNLGGQSEVRNTVLRFADDLTSVSESEELRVKSEEFDDVWYDLSGRKYDSKPTKKGVYIHQGEKVAI